MKKAPEFFETVRQKALERWNQLEQDPELAGPWHQLFKQVQSPRHILSELLQNADDAGATEASVRIEHQSFIFEHNGDDFSEEHFASLCRFGYSNKRSLHTIGFRGIGFKSTFSLGDCVKLFTPSLSICFFRRRFTEPHWLSEETDTLGRTRIFVEIVDHHREKEVQKNLDEWLKSPVSLLFFKNIRRMHIGDNELRWGSMGPGPIANSEWMALNEDTAKDYLLIRSDAEVFPDEALDEIRQERMLGIDDGIEFPPCNIEIVLGAMGRLYVVLPTGIETELPFASNAPFIQDPARLKIKDPETSPTNRWLLERTGKLAASVMLRWLHQSDFPTLERVPAYGLLPDVDRSATSLEGVCGTTVEEAFEQEIDGKPLLLTEDGSLTPANQSVAIPRQLFDVWPADQSAVLLDEEGRPALCQHIEPPDREKLVNWDIVDEIDKQTLIQTLQRKHLPRPKTWQQLLNLWVYVAPEVTGYRHYVSAEDVRMVPVQGKDVLYASSEVVRLGEKKLLQSEEDWVFLAQHLIVLNQNWLRFLAERRRIASENNETIAAESVKAAYAVLKQISLNNVSDVNKMIDQVAAGFFSNAKIHIQECVRLSQIAAKLRATVGDAFKFVATDRKLRSPKSGILFDPDGSLRKLLPESKRESQILHPDYAAQFSFCSSDEWVQWVSSGRAGLGTFVPLVPSRKPVGRRPAIDDLLRIRGFEGSLEHRYTDPWFHIDDWDFGQAFWEHWQSLEAENPAIWSKIAERILSEKKIFWRGKASAQIIERASNGHERTIRRLSIRPEWALKLRNRRCIPDTHGTCRKPGELLRRTPETESLLDVEPFVHGSLDQESTRPLLDLIGVRSTPTGPDRLLDYLRALAKAKSPPFHEVEKWYSRLDQMVNNCTTEDFQEIRRAFYSERLILTQHGIWEATPGVFLSTDEEDVPDAEIIRTSVSDLTLWRKIGVADRPTVALVIEWLESLPANKPLKPDDIRRARSLLSRHPIRIWEECRHWLNLAGEWAAVEDLSYSLTMQTLLPWRHLHQWVKRNTADLQALPAEVTSNPPFSNLPTLATRVEERFHRDLRFTGGNVAKAWLTAFGTEFRQVEFDTEDDTQRIRSLADRLATTKWCETQGLEIIPYINGTPAGTPRRTDVLWLNDVLYVDHLPKGKLARRIPEEIGKVFGRTDIKAALDYSFERSPQDVKEYLEENFKLCPLSAIPEETDDQVEPLGTDDGEPSHSDDGEGADQNSGETERSKDQGTAKDEEDDIQYTGATETEDEFETNFEEEAELPRPRPSPKPAKPDIIERFAMSQGYRKDSEDRYFHEDGSWIARANGDRFPWERRAADGKLIRYYWPKNHCLERDPLQIEADVWTLIEEYPETYAFVLADIEGGPVEVAGSHLRAMRDEGEITLFPSTYRLVYNDDQPV